MYNERVDFGSTGEFELDPGIIFKLGMALLFANILIYVPGLLWLGQLYGWDQPILAWGLTPFIVGDLLKLALTASLIPLIWKLVDKFK